MKRCFQCKTYKSESEMAVARGAITDFCKECKSKNQNDYYERKKFHFPFRNYLASLKGRASKSNIPFDLTVEDIKQIWTPTCPALGISLLWDHDPEDDSSCELDRIVPERGYVKGNVQWISRRANRIKNDSSIEELEKVLQYLNHKKQNDFKSTLYKLQDCDIVLDGVSLQERNDTFERRPRVRQTYSKLSEKEVVEIKKLLKQGDTQKKEIAERFGISTKNLWKISSGKSWTHIQID